MKPHQLPACFTPARPAVDNIVPPTLTKEDFAVEKDPLDVVAGDIVQLAPDSDATYGGCLMIVEKPKVWGVQGYILLPRGERLYWRAEWNEFALVGKCVWRGY
jgi:hypothetical protein